MQKSVVLKIYIIFYCKNILEKPKKNLQIWLFKPKLAFFKKYSKTSMSSKRGKNQYFFKNKNSHGGENIFQQVDKILDHSDKKCFGFTWPWPQLSQCDKGENCNFLSVTFIEIWTMKYEKTSITLWKQ